MPTIKLITPEDFRAPLRFLRVDDMAAREVKKCAWCKKRRMTTPTNEGPICNECLAAL